MANLVYDIKDKPKVSQLIVLALQQLLAILAATIAVPTIIGLPTQIPAAILGAGVGTLVYQLFTKFKSPVFLGSSFAFLSSLGVAVAYGYCGIILGSVVAGLVYVAIAIVIHFVGTNWVDKLMPPVIIGPTVALIGLSLAGSAMGDIVRANSSVTYSSYNLISLLCGLVAFFVIIICSTQKKYKMAKLIPFILGIVAGYAVATIFTVIG
ncbi:MAG: uracil-xanthine permease, partial [Clostridia bacterium]|nr:uracil-xanthine permease [Clostridia bacterium]